MDETLSKKDLTNALSDAVTPSKKDVIYGAVGLVSVAHVVSHIAMPGYSEGVGDLINFVTDAAAIDTEYPGFSLPEGILVGGAAAFGFNKSPAATTAGMFLGAAATLGAVFYDHSMPDSMAIIDPEPQVIVAGAQDIESPQLPDNVVIEGFQPVVA